MQKIKKYNSIFLVNADPIKNAGFFKEYFINNTQNFVSFHFFPAYSSKTSYMEKYINGDLVLTKELDGYKGDQVFIKSVFNYIAFVYTLILQVKRGSYLITNAPIYCNGSSLFKKIKSINYILWLGDYYPDNSFPMNIYNRILGNFNRSFKYVIYLNPRLKDVYYNKKTSKSDGKVISLGIKKMYSRKNTALGKKTRVGFIGIIRKQQGLDLFFKFLVNNENCKLEVVGDGYHLQFYKHLARKLKIQNKVKFYGSVEDLSKVFKKWDIGIALYENTEYNLSKYAEPTKIKDYLSYGLPVITTGTTYFSKEISDFNAGQVINESTEELDKAIDDIVKNYKKYLEGVDRLVNKYEYSNWYDEMFKFIARA